MACEVDTAGRIMLLLPLKKILCPTDFSDCSYAALRNAAELARQFDAELCLLHVVAQLPKPTSLAGQGAAQPADDREFADYPELAGYEDALYATAQQRLHEVIEKQVPRGVKARLMVGHGDAASEIARIAEDERVGLVVIATHGMTGWRNLQLGSVAERVVRLSTRPVLSIRTPCGAA
jgi:nucleotide-binding universal stress UspA family protein